MITEINKYQHRHKLQPYDHQRQEFETTRDKKAWGLFWEMGTGKTKVILDTAVHLFNKCEIDGVIVIAPKGCYLNWINEIENHVQDDVPIKIASWSAVMNKQRQWDFDQIMQPQDDRLDFLLVNTEAFSSERAFNEVMRFCKTHYAMVVIDESSAIKNPKAGRTKRIMKLREAVEYRRIMSGTPVSQGPLDMFTQSEFIGKSQLGFRTFTEYRSFYAILVNIPLGGGRSFPKIEGYRNLGKLEQDIKKFSSRVLKTDCLDLPPKIYETWNVEHTPAQARAYRELCNEAMTQLDNGEMITQTDALGVVLRLSQINSGFLKNSEGEIVRIPTNRPQELLEVLSQLQGKALIWARFHEDMHQIREALSAEFGLESHGFYYGESSDSERADTLDRFRNDDRCRWFVGSAATGGMSLTLTQASSVIYYTHDYSLQNRLQSEDRAHRIGQTKPVLYMDMVVRKTIDAKVLKAVKAKKDLSTLILNDFRDLISE